MAGAARLLQDMGLIGLPLKRHRCTTSDHQRPVAPKSSPAPSTLERWSTDIRLDVGGWLLVVDLFSRRVVGAIQPHLRVELALEALHMALERRVPEAGANHSDRGCQYAPTRISGAALTGSSAP